MAFTIGRYGVSSLLSLGKLLLCCYATSIGFIVIVLGAICWTNGVSLWRFLVYIREELLIVVGTSSSEPALPRLMLKMENLGCSKAITGLVIPAGYSFNLDGTSIYLAIALLFVAQATNTDLSLRQQIFIVSQPFRSAPCKHLQQSVGRLLRIPNLKVRSQLQHIRLRR